MPSRVARRLVRVLVASRRRSWRARCARDAVVPWARRFRGRRLRQLRQCGFGRRRGRGRCRICRDGARALPLDTGGRRAESWQARGGRLRRVGDRCLQRRIGGGRALGRRSLSLDVGGNAGTRAPSAGRPRRRGRHRQCRGREQERQPRRRLELLQRPVLLGRVRPRLRRAIGRIHVDRGRRPRAVHACDGHTPRCVVLRRRDRRRRLERRVSRSLP